MGNHSWLSVPGILCIVVFAAELFIRTGELRANHTAGWGVAGLLGASIFVTNGVVTNGIEMLAILNVDFISERQEFSYLLFRLPRVLFTAEIVSWSMMIFGFSMAGLQSHTLPKSLIALGIIHSVAGFLTTGIYMLVGGAVASEFNRKGT